MSRTLVVYYSLFGQTECLAREIAAQTGGTLRQLVPERSYSFDYNTAAKEVRAQITRGYCPILAAGNESIDAFDTVWIGSPNWFKTFAPPVLTFLTAHSFAGKTVVPFCTHGGGGFGSMLQDAERACPGVYVVPGVAVNGDDAAARVAQRLAQLQW